MYIPPWHTNKMLYIGLICLLAGIILGPIVVPTPPKGSFYTDPPPFSMLVTFFWMVGLAFTPVGVYYANKEKKRNK